MLTSLWADHPGLRCVVGMKGGVTRHFWFIDTDDALAKATELDAAGYNVYFAPSIFDGAKVDARRQETNPRTGRPYSGREQATTALMPALWLDLDCGAGKDYPDPKVAAEALAAWLEKTRIPYPTHVVSSGHGLHVYWRLTTPVPHDRWLPVAKHLKQTCRVHGLHADPARTSDSASLMRPPGTHNHKRGETAPVRLLTERDDTVDLHAFRAALPLVGPQGTVPVARPGGEWDTTTKAPPGDANKIADKCQQMGAMRFHKGKLPEPVWRAGLSILWRCEGADELIHAWSKGDERYDPEQTEDKARGTLGPATCQHFAEINPDGCVGCPFAGNVASPINLAYAEEMPEIEGGEDGEDSPLMSVPGYAYTRGGIYKEPLGGEGPMTRVADIPVWIEDAREYATSDGAPMRASLTLAWKDVRGRQYSANIAQAELHDTRAWMKWLADNNLASFVEAAQMSRYISQMHKLRYQKHGSSTIYDKLGWYRNRSLFVLGVQGITVDTVEEVLVDAKGGITGLAPKGDLDAWKAGVSLLGKPEYRAQAFGLLMGFAAPLLELVNKSGAVVAFVGESGKGKTMCAETGLSVFADPKAIQGSGRDTINALGTYLGQLRHVPALVDEVTTMRDKDMRDLIYMAANGADKAALNQKRERQSVSTWRTVTMLTSNHSIVDRHQKDIEEAHRRRLVEVPVLTMVKEADAATIYQTIYTNYGVAAAPYLQTVMQHMDKVPALFALMERQVVQWGYGDPADRFGMWTCSAALLGGILAYVAGVLPFNPVPIVQAVCKVAAENNETILNPAELAHDALFELLTTHSKRICVWTAGKMAVDDTDDPIARIAESELWVRASELQKSWDELHIYRKALDPWLEAVAPGGKRYYRLAPGTPPVYAYKFDMEALDWDMKTLKGE